MPSIRSTLSRVGLATAAFGSAFVASTADGGLHNGTTWNVYRQADVLATFALPAFTLNQQEYAASEIDPNDDNEANALGLLPPDETAGRDVEHPTLIFFSILTEDMLEIEWIDGDDEINVLGHSIDDDVDTMDAATMMSDGLIGQPFLPTGGTIDEDLDSNTAQVPACFTLALDGTPNDGVANPAEITACDEAEDEDGIADFWDLSPNGQPVLLEYIEPPILPADAINPADSDDEAVALSVYRYYGLGGARWGGGRPSFTHPDGEAIWRYAQREYGPNGTTAAGVIEYRESLPYDPIDDDDEDSAATAIILALREIEKIANVRFIRRDPDGDVSGSIVQGPFGPPASLNGQLILDATSQQVLIGDDPRVPEDDHPWILFTAGPTFAGLAMAAGTAFESGSARGPSVASHVDVDYVFDDFNGDGFPDLLDSPSTTTTPLGPQSADERPDVFFLSQNGVPGTEANDFWNPAVVNGAGTGSTRIAQTAFEDYNEDGVADLLLAIEGDFRGDGTYLVGVGTNPAFAVPTLAVPNAMDVDGDGLPDDIDGDGLLDVPFDSGPSIAFNVGGVVAANTAGLSTTNDDVDAIGLAEPTNMGLIQLSVAADGVGDAIFGVAIHEMLHQMGYQHEMTRPDRESFVQINFENIDATLASQYFISLGGIILGADADGDGNPDYDFESIMHYDSCGVLPNGVCSFENRSIDVLPPFEDFQSEIGQRGELSAGDVAMIQAVYLKPQLFELGPCVADLDGDTRITFTDIGIFINLYNACPQGQINPAEPLPSSCTLPGTALQVPPVVDDSICRIVDQCFGNFDGIIDTLDIIGYFEKFQSARGCSSRAVVPITGGNPVADNSFGL
ncbi:MAG: M12 family metallopeptidase [Planctomycetota bacterium]